MDARSTDKAARARGRAFWVDSVEAMALRILGAVLVLLAAFWISRTTQRYLVRRLQRQDTGGAQAIQTYRRIVQAVVWVIGGAIALHTLGIDLTHIFTAGGLFAVALAFAMKDLAENLVSGLLLSLGGRSSVAMCSVCSRRRNLCRLKEAGSSNRLVRTKGNGRHYQCSVGQNAISNYTHGYSLYRLVTTVGVAYDSI